jgi:hypothetical protein
MNKGDRIDQIQRWAARIIAQHREGVGLRLIGGFRYRLIDGSGRTSADLDYHWDHDLGAKRDEVVRLLQRQLLPEVKRRLGFDGLVYASNAPGEESPFVKTAEIALYGSGLSGRMEIPVDFTRIPCLDAPVAATIDGTVHLAASDADMVESKILAVFLRTPPAARDFVDLFLFRDRLHVESMDRLATKCGDMKLGPAWMDEAWQRIRQQRATVEAGIERVLSEQMEPAVADNLRLAGGAGMICGNAIELIEQATRKARGET